LPIKKIRKAPAPTRTSKPPLRASESAEAFGPFPLIAGEDAADYESLHARISGAVEPADFIEKMYVREMVDLTWEALRYRRLTAAFLSDHTRDALVDRLKGSLGYRPAWELIAGWAKGDASAVHAVETWIAGRGLSVSSMTTWALAEKFDVIERFNRFVANLEVRRNNALHEIQRHRLLLAEQLRHVVKEIDAQPAEAQDLSQQNSQAAE
jgi:hypothetical protein